jgi:hypothetical protein
MVETSPHRSFPDRRYLFSSLTRTGGTRGTRRGAREDYRFGG